MTIETTTNYDKFSKLRGNRPLRVRHVKDLVASIGAVDLLAETPIIVNEQYQIIDGQHRLAAAEELKVPVYYIVRKGASMTEVKILNIGRDNWSYDNYVDAYISEGIKDYQVLKDYMDIYEMPITVAMPVLEFGFKGASWNKSAEMRRGLKNGEFEVNFKDEADDYGQKVQGYRRFFTKNTWRSRSFLASVMFMLKQNKVTHEEMMEKLETRGMEDKWGIQGTVKDYLRLYETIYNRGRQTKAITRFF